MFDLEEFYCIFISLKNFELYKNLAKYLRIDRLNRLSLKNDSDFFKSFRALYSLQQTNQ